MNIILNVKEDFSLFDLEENYLFINIYLRVYMGPVNFIYWISKLNIT